MLKADFCAKLQAEAYHFSNEGLYEWSYECSYEYSCVHNVHLDIHINVNLNFHKNNPLFVHINIH